jgi:hypothetical protein
VAWMDDPDPGLDVSDWWRQLAEKGGMNKRDWKEIRMKSTLVLPAPGSAPAAPTQETYADKLAVEAMEAENERDTMADELATARKESANLRSELDALRSGGSADVVAKAKLEKELTATKTELARLQAQLASGAGGGGDGGGGTVMYFLIALVVLLLGVVGSLMMAAPQAAAAAAAAGGAGEEATEAD